MAYPINVSFVALEQLNRTIANSEANEAFGFIVRIADSFMRIINNFKTSLKGFHKSFKRSELTAYHESHTLVLKAFFKQRNFNTKLEVPIPSGMKVGYLQATTTLETLYATINITNTITTLQTYFTEVQKSGHLVPTETATQTISQVTKESVESILRNVFTNDKTLDVPITQVIASFDDLIQIDTHILGYEKIFQTAESVCADLDKLEKIIDTVVTRLEQHTIPATKAEVQSLYLLVRTASVQLDMLGVVFAELQRVEHNFVLVLRKLVAAN